MIETFNFTIAGVGDIPVSACSWKQAQEIIQAYIDKHSLNWIITSTDE